MLQLCCNMCTHDGQVRFWSLHSSSSNMGKCPSKCCGQQTVTVTDHEPLLKTSARADNTSSEVPTVPDNSASNRSRMSAGHAQHSSNDAFSHQPATDGGNEPESASNLAGSSDPLTPPEEESSENHSQYRNQKIIC